MGTDGRHYKQKKHHNVQEKGIAGTFCKNKCNIYRIFNLKQLHVVLVYSHGSHQCCYQQQPVAAFSNNL